MERVRVERVRWTSSPMMKTFSSRASSSSRALFRASRTVI